MYLYTYIYIWYTCNQSNGEDSPGHLDNHRDKGYSNNAGSEPAFMCKTEKKNQNDTSNQTQEKINNKSRKVNKKLIKKNIHDVNLEPVSEVALKQIQTHSKGKSCHACD